MYLDADWRAVHIDREGCWCMVMRRDEGKNLFQLGERRG